MLLALGTFVAGVHFAWQILILGIIMAIAVSAIAWLTQSGHFFAFRRIGHTWNIHNLLIATGRPKFALSVRKLSSLSIRVVRNLNRFR